MSVMATMRRGLSLLTVVMLTSVIGCSRDRGSVAEDPAVTRAAGSASASQQPPSPTVPTSTAADDPLPPATSPYDALPEGLASVLDAPFTGDLDALVKRRLIRVGTVFNRTHYFIDKGVQRGLAYEGFKRFEDDLNTRLNTGLLRVHVVMVPVARDQLFPALQAGKVDLVAAALTVTPERRKLVDFSTPTRTDVSEIVVTAPGSAPVATPDDLSGREVFVRKSSSYYESLVGLNSSLTARHKPVVVIKEAPDALEDDDVLEMVNAGLVEATVMDDFIVEFWRQVFPGIQPQSAAVRTGGDLAIGVRKTNPQLRDAVNHWIKEVGTRSAFANILGRRYLQNTTFVKTATADAEQKKLQTLLKFFQTYGERYDVDYLLMAAQGYQESQLDQSVTSRVGAIGVMQIMPATGKELKVGDIHQLEPNIHGGAKYLDQLMTRYFPDAKFTEAVRPLFAFASYNAGPGNISKMRKEAAKRGLDPDKWFNNVELVVAEKIGMETTTYVRNIYKYYTAYRLVLDAQDATRKAREAVKVKP